MRFPGWQSILRNWHVSIIGLVVTIALAGIASFVSPAKYVATSQVVLLPPLSQPNQNYNGVVNPYMGLDGLQSMAQVVANAMMDDGTQKALKGAGVSRYTVTYNSMTAGPILDLSVTESSPAQARAAIETLDNQAPVTVASLQKAASISSRAFILAKVIAGPSAPSKSTKTQLRVEVLAVAVGIVLTLLAVSIADGLRIRRRQRGSADPDATSHDIPAYTEPAERTRPEPQGSPRKSTAAAGSANGNHR